MSNNETTTDLNRIENTSYQNENDEQSMTRLNQIMNEVTTVPGPFPKNAEWGAAEQVFEENGEPFIVNEKGKVDGIPPCQKPHWTF